MKDDQSTTKPSVFNRNNSQSRPRPGAVYIGRPSLFGNPFVIGKDGPRDAVIEKFEKYLRSNPALLSLVKKELVGRDLVCFCAPKRCHGDVLLKVANDEA